MEKPQKLNLHQILSWWEDRRKRKVKEKKVVTKDTAHLQGLKAILSLVFLGRFDKVAMVAALFQLHHNVQETRCAPPRSL